MPKNTTLHQDLANITLQLKQVRAAMRLLENTHSSNIYVNTPVGLLPIPREKVEKALMENMRYLTNDSASACQYLTTLEQERREKAQDIG